MSGLFELVGRVPPRPKLKTEKWDEVELVPPASRRANLRWQKKLFTLAQEAQLHGWSAEELLSDEIKRQERGLRGVEVTAACAGSRSAKAVTSHSSVLKNTSC